MSTATIEPMVIRRRRSRPLLPWLVAALVVVTLACASVGSVSIPVPRILALIAARLGLDLGVVAPERDQAILFAIRMPRVILAGLIGAGLGASGAAMQGVFRNPLVDPGLLGVSSGAALSAVAAIVLGARIAGGLPPSIAPYLVSFAAFAGGLLVMRIAQRLARFEGRTSIATLLLAGIAINALAGALTGLLTFLASDAELRTITFWGLGSVGGASWRVVIAAAPFIVIPLALFPRWSRSLDALLLGDSDARLLGFNIEGTKRVVMLLAAVVVGASVAVAGVVGFVGLVVPHLVRLLAGPAHRVVLSSSAIAGAILVLCSDAIARTVVTPAELPLGVVTASIGAPFFLVLLVRERRRLA